MIRKQLFCLGLFGCVVLAGCSVDEETLDESSMSLVEEPCMALASESDDTDIVSLIDPCDDPYSCGAVCSSTSSCSKSCNDIHGSVITCGEWGSCLAECSSICTGSSSCSKSCSHGGATTCGSYGTCDTTPALSRVLVEKVRYCRNSLFCNSRRSHGEYHWWDYFGVAKDKQKRTFLSRAVNPPRADVRHLVFLAAGQQFGDGNATLVTGQPSDWKDDFSTTEMDEFFNLHPSSLPYRMFDNGHRNRADTFAGLAFDARFNQHIWEDEKVDIESAYYEWLKEKFYVDRLESIFLAGFSRGGCLAARLARRFNQDYPNIPVIVALYDPVCTQNQGEMGIGSTKITNPENGDYEVWATNLDGQYPDKTNLRILNMVGGEEATSVSIDARAMSHHTAADEGDWYDHEWYDMTHGAMGSSHNLVTRALTHLRNSCAALGC